VSDIFIRSNNLKEYLAEAMSIYIASAYFNKAVIDKIKDDLNTLPQKGGKQLRFLLNHDFHEDESMRSVLINQLLEIPNTEVRIYEGDRLFHAKLYIFEDGNRVFTAVGSFNATAGGLGGNIEAGVKTSNREIHREAKRFFEEYWDQSRIATHDPDARFVERRFQLGDGVVIVKTSKKGVITNTKPIFNENEWQYLVFVDGDMSWYKEDELERQLITDFCTEPDFKYAGTQGGDVSTWFMNYFLEKIYDMPETVFTSYKSTRTRSIAYQFRPLFKITNVKEKRILIADEVGLGKTIEAGIIIKEFISRFDAKNILIVVPNSLKLKWKDELQIRFEEFFDLVSAGEFLKSLAFWETHQVGGIISGIVSYDTLASPKIKAKVESMNDLPSVDLVILDEAHHLKNPQTVRHKVIKKLTKHAKAMVMLTATPVQTSPDDLFYLLQILLPYTFGDMPVTAYRPLLTVNEFLNRAIHFLRIKDLQHFKEAIEAIRSKRFIRQNLLAVDGFLKLLEKCDRISDSTEDLEQRKLVEELFRFNVFGGYLNRTLRRDVAEKFAERDIETIEYEYTLEEEAVYKGFVELCVENSATKSAFNRIMPERRAASSINGVIKEFQRDHLETGWEEWISSNDEELE